MKRVITAAIRRGTAAWHGRGCRLPAAGPVWYVPVQQARPSWAEVPRSCICRWRGVRAGWVMAERKPGCLAEHGSYGL